MTNILLIAGRYQLGNNAGLFQDAHYVGYGLELPFRKTWIDTDAKEIGFVFHTTDVETWAIERVTELRLTAKRSGGSRIRPTPTVLPKSSRSKCRQRPWRRF